MEIFLNTIVRIIKKPKKIFFKFISIQLQLKFIQKSFSHFKNFFCQSDCCFRMRTGEDRGWDVGHAVHVWVPCSGIKVVRILLRNHCKQYWPHKLKFNGIESEITRRNC
jgi:hypothetical protein